MNKPDLNFPTSLPNDIEDYRIFFRRKFPEVIRIYQGIAEKYWDKPEELDGFCQKLVKELWQGYNQIKSDFHSIDKDKRTTEFLLNIDQRLQKLYCFRFWIINYALCEGPIHKFYTDMISRFAEILGEDENPEIENKNIEKIERILLRGDYKDLYLINALNGIEVYRSLKGLNKIKDIVNELEKEVNDGNEKNAYELIDKIILFLKNEDKTDPKIKKIFEDLKEALGCSIVKGDNSVVYVTIIGAIEFYEKNIELEIEYKNIKEEIKRIFNAAENKINKQEFDELKSAYEMLLKLKKFKDDFGSIDSEILPLWMVELQPELEEKIKAPKRSCTGGPGSTFYSFPWHMDNYPNFLQKIFRIDNSDFNVKNS